MKLCYRFVDGRIHMHIHDNPTDNQHHSARTYEVSFGSRTPLRNPSDTARSTFGHPPAPFPSKARMAQFSWLSSSRAVEVPPLGDLLVVIQGVVYRLARKPQRRGELRNKIDMSWITTGVCETVGVPERAEGITPIGVTHSRFLTFTVTRHATRTSTVCRSSIASCLFVMRAVTTCLFVMKGTFGPDTLRHAR